jgi:hypothetical protein
MTRKELYRYIIRYSKQFVVDGLLPVSLESVGATAGEASFKSLKSISARILVVLEGELGETEGTDGLQFFPFFLPG